MKILELLFCCFFILQVKADMFDTLHLDTRAIAKAVKEHRYDKIEKMFVESLIQRTENANIAKGIREQQGSLPQSFFQTDVKSLTKPRNGHVYGESKFQYKNTLRDAGFVMEQSGGHNVFNTDGSVKEFIYKK